MIIFLYGEDTFRSKQKLSEFKNKFYRDIDKGMINLQELNGEKTDVESLKQAFLAQGFFIGKRMIIIENLLSRNKNKNIQEETLKFLSEKGEAGDENIVVFWENLGSKSKDYRGKSLSGELFNFLKKGKYAYEFAPLDKVRLAVWIKKRIEEKGKKIKPEAVNLLMDLTGGDMWKLNGEIEKLVIYSDEIITNEEIKEIVSEQFSESVFELADAIAGKNKKLFISLLDKHLRGGIEESYLLTMLIRQFRLVIYAADRLQKNPYVNLAAELKIPFFVERKIKSQAGKYTGEQLKHIYNELLNIDISLKKGYFNPELLFYRLIA